MSGREAGGVGQRAGLGDRAHERGDPPVVAAQLEELLDDGAVLALERRACVRRRGSSSGCSSTSTRSWPAESVCAAPAVPRCRPRRDTARAAAGEANALGDLGDGAHARELAVVARDEQHALVVADVDRQRDVHGREDHGVLGGDEKKCRHQKDRFLCLRCVSHCSGNSWRRQRLWDGRAGTGGAPIRPTREGTHECRTDRGHRGRRRRPDRPRGLRDPARPQGPRAATSSRSGAGPSWTAIARRPRTARPRPTWPRGRPRGSARRPTCTRRAHACTSAGSPTTSCRSADSPEEVVERRQTFADSEPPGRGEQPAEEPAAADESGGTAIDPTTRRPTRS